MNLNHCGARKLISLSLVLLLFAGCSAAAAPAASIPAAGSSEVIPVVTGTKPKAEQKSAELYATPTPPLQENPAPSSSPASPGTDEVPSEQSSAAISPSPAAEIISVSPTPSVMPHAPSPVPTATVMPVNPAENKEKPTELVYPVSSFSNASVLCLTFDDGGNKKAVEKALDVLEQYDLQCTFFVIGKYLKSHQELWKKAIEQGHQICNHTQNHKWLSELSSDEVKKEILAWEASAAEVLGEEYVQKMKKEFPYLRLPGGAGSQSKRLMGILSELGYTPVGWNIESYYAVLRNHDLKNDPLQDIAGDVAAHITKRASAGSVILLHFNAYDTAALDAILKGISEKKLTMELLSEQDF
jgi:peptidoglycan-N-acetylmuramic acid deacetylase